MKGLKFIPTATVTRNKIRRQLSQDNKAFERRVRLKYIFHGLNKTIHSLYVKSNWEPWPPVQSSAKLENYTEEEKLQNIQTTTQLVTQRTKQTCPGSTLLAKICLQLFSQK